MVLNNDLNESLNSGENIELSKLIDFAKNLMINLDIKEDNGNPLKGINEAESEIHLDAIVNLARKWINPSTLSLLSTANKLPNIKNHESGDLSQIKLSIKRLSNQMEETQDELAELREKVDDLTRQNTKLHSQLTAMKRKSK